VVEDAMNKSTLDERIAQAKIEVANSACANPKIWPEWQRLKAAERALEAAKVELEKAKMGWEKLIADAQPKYKALLD
jgi:hypothetical protein